MSSERAFFWTTITCGSRDDVEESSVSSSSPSSLSITRAILIADFDEVRGLTLRFDGVDAALTVTTSLVSRSRVKVSMIRPERRRRLETRSSSLENFEPFRLTMALFRPLQPFG